MLQKKSAIIVFLIILIAIPFTVFIAQKQQNLQQKAAETTINQEITVQEIQKVPDTIKDIILDRLSMLKPALNQETINKIKKDHGLDKKESKVQIKAVQNVILVKFKSEISEFDKTQIQSKNQQYTVPDSLKEIDQKYKIKKVERLFKEPVDENIGTRFNALRNKLSKNYKITIEEANVDQALKDLSKNPNVEYAELDYIYQTNQTTTLPNDNYFNLLWGMNNVGQTGGKIDSDIDAPEAWAVISNANNIKVAVLDTGIYYKHRDLANNIWNNSGEMGSTTQQGPVPNCSSQQLPLDKKCNNLDDDGNGYIDDWRGYDFTTCAVIDQFTGGCLELKNKDNDPIDDAHPSHGTHVSGTIGAVGNNSLGIAGIAWSVTIMPVKILNIQGYGTASEITEGILYAITMGAKIINASWGGGSFSQTIFDAISEANNANVLFVASAGNSSNDNDISPTYPSSYNLPNIISVAATEDRDSLAYFSNYGLNSVDLAAPGVSIFSVSNDPMVEYQRLSGTSMAAPHVSGAVALTWAKFPTDPPAAIKERLLGGVDTTFPLATKTEAGGRLSLYNTISSNTYSYNPKQYRITVFPSEIPLSRTIRLSNYTNQSINWSATTSDIRLTLSKTSGIINPASSDKISFTTSTNLSLGTHNGTLNFNLTGVQTDQFSIPITLNVVSEKVIYVDASNTSISDGSREHPFRTINEAMSEATDNSRIYVNPGVYEEAVVITNNNLILEGADVNSTIIRNFPRLSAITISPNASNPDKITGVKVRNLTIEMKDGRAAGAFEYSPGIQIVYADNITIQSNRIIQKCEVNFCPVSTEASYGILAISITNSTIKDNYIKNFVHNILFYWFENRNNKVIENYLVKGKSTGLFLDTGYINDNYPGPVEISDNFFINNKYGVYNFADRKGKIYNNFFLQNQWAISDRITSGSNSIYNNSFVNNQNQVFIANGTTENWINSFNNMGNYWSNFDEDSEGANDSNNDGVIDTPYIINTLNQDTKPYKYALGRGFPKPAVSISPILLYPGDQFTLSGQFSPQESNNKIILNWHNTNEIEAEIVSWSLNEIIAKVRSNTAPGLYNVWLSVSSQQLPINPGPFFIGVYVGIVGKDDVPPPLPALLTGPIATPIVTSAPVPLCNACTADFNRDNGVDIGDFSRLVRCYNREVVGYCETTDVDKNGEVGIEDFACLKKFFGKQCKQ